MLLMASKLRSVAQTKGHFNQDEATLNLLPPHQSGWVRVSCDPNGFAVESGATPSVTLTGVVYQHVGLLHGIDGQEGQAVLLHPASPKRRPLPPISRAIPAMRSATWAQDADQLGVKGGRCIGVQTKHRPHNQVVRSAVGEALVAAQRIGQGVHRPPWRIGKSLAGQHGAEQPQGFVGQGVVRDWLHPVATGAGLDGLDHGVAAVPADPRGGRRHPVARGRRSTAVTPPLALALVFLPVLIIPMLVISEPVPAAVVISTGFLWVKSSHQTQCLT